LNPAEANPHRILVIGLNYAPEPVGIGPYTAGLAETLAAHGHVVEVIAGKPYYPQWQPDPAFAGNGWHRAMENGVHVTRCPHYVPADPGGLKRVIHLASFACSAALPALKAALRGRRGRPAVVIAIVPALFSVPIAWLAARFARAKLWVHIQDFEVEAALATGLIQPANPLARLALWIEARLLRSAERVSAISPQMCAKLAEKGVPAERMTELRNWSDPRFAVDPAGAAALRKEWGLGDRLVALYSGNIARKQGAELLIDAAQRLALRKDIVFVICGAGPNRAVLAQLAQELANVQLHELQPACRMGALLAMADLHLLPQIAGAADLVLPSKLTNMLASGRPVIATAAPGTGLYAEVAGCGLLAPPGDAAALAEAVLQLADDPAMRVTLGAAAQVRAIERWSKDAIITRMERTLAAI